MHIRRYNLIQHSLYILMLFLMMPGCKKIDDYLDAKSNLNDVRPQTLSDFQAILDNNYSMNNQMTILGLNGADNFYMTDAQYNAAPINMYRNLYIWDKVIQYNVSAYYSYPYQVVEYCNIVLDGLNKIERNTANEATFDYVKGQALFFKAYACYNLSSTFCKQYDSSGAGGDLGLVLRNSSDVNERPGRSTVADSYNQMISDAKAAAALLPVSSSYQTRPSRPAAEALLSKIYLNMGAYSEALNYATAALNQFSVLLDYNNTDLIKPSGTYRFPTYPNNPEIIWYAQGTGNNVLWNFASALGNVDTLLYAMYAPDDLRKTLFFIKNSNGLVQNRGGYTGNGYNFSGIATNEVLLIKAECEARMGQSENALADLNKLLLQRYQTGTYQPIQFSTAQLVLDTILSERRKELPFTGQVRWEDLRRLNREPRYAKTLVRIIGGQTYQLSPGDSRYVLPIPDDEIQLLGIQQNER
ncbi:MAG: RagB/SusD family nutrient uptake outer membrane protein [Arachidicoccus sp.]|nr:RagB/SusD family nutrient uptake outer membrane protein [Arachidicoccus sp.]